MALVGTARFNPVLSICFGHPCLRRLAATFLPHKGGGVMLTVLPKAQQANLPVFFLSAPFVLSVKRRRCDSLVSKKEKY